MSDNLKLIEAEIQSVLDENGSPGSILALLHKGFALDIVRKAGKYSGVYFQAIKNGNGVYPAGTFSFEGNAMNTESRFNIRVSKLSSDLNDVGFFLETIAENSVIHYKDKVGRSTIYRFFGYSMNDSDLSNIFYEIQVESIGSNINYTFQDAENETCCITFYNKPSVAEAGVSSVTGDGVNNTDPSNPELTFPNADQVSDSSTSNKFVSQTEKDLITENKNAIQSLTSSYSRRKAVINIVDNTATPPTELIGDRYILDFSGLTNSSWDGANPGDIVEFDGSDWLSETPLEGWIAYVDNQNKDALFVDDGSPDWQLRPVATENTIHTDVSNEFGVVPPEETNPADNDRFLIESSGNSFSKRWLSWSTIKSKILALFIEPNIKGKAQIEQSATGTINADFINNSVIYINQTGNVTLTITNPTLAIGETATRLTYLKPNGFEITIPASIENEMIGEIDDLSLTYWFVTTYVNVDGTIKINPSNLSMI